MMGEVVEGGRRQAGRDEVSSGGGTASEHRHLSNSHRRPHYSPDGLVGGRSLERRDNPDQVRCAIAAAGTPSEILAGEEVRSIGDRSTQLASQEQLLRLACPVAGGSDSGLRVWAGSRWLVTRCRGSSPAVGGTRSSSHTCGGCHTAGPSRSPLHSVLGVRSRIQARRCRPAGERALWHGRMPTVTSSGHSTRATLKGSSMDTEVGRTAGTATTDPEPRTR